MNEDLLFGLPGSVEVDRIDRCVFPIERSEPERMMMTPDSIVSNPSDPSAFPNLILLNP